MVYKYHQPWRDSHILDSSIFDTYDLSPKEKKQINNMRKSKPVIPYTLKIECSSYWGSFEREFLGYSIGILDDVQMHIDYSDEERALFWREVFNKEPIDFKEASASYELYRDYLLETFQVQDDWEQLTFYTIDWDLYHRNERNVLKIQLAKPLSREWEEIIVPRMKSFFDKKISKYLDKDAELLCITLCDRNGWVVKEY